MISRKNITEFFPLVLLLLIHLLFLVSTQFTLWPEMVVYPYLINKGFLLYRDIINPYPPFLTWFLAIFAKFFGYQVFSYQILTWGVILLLDFLIFSITKKITKSYKKAFLSTAFFVFLSIPFKINGLWFDLVQTPFILLSFFWFYQFLENKKGSSLYLSSFFLSIAFFIKQQVIILGLFYFIVLFFKHRKQPLQFSKNIFLSFVPFFFLFIFLSLFFVKQHNFKDFLFWVFYFPFFKASSMPGYILLPTLRQLLPLFSLFLIFIPILLLRKFNLSLIFLISFVLLIFAYPRFDYFHLIPSLAVLSLLAGFVFETIKKLRFPVKIISIFLSFFIFIFFARYSINNWTKEVRFFEKDIQKTAVFLQKNTKVTEPLYIQNGPDQLFVLAQRLPTKPWADEFPWYLELQGIQEKIVKSLAISPPRFIIYKSYDLGSQYEIGAYKPQKISSFIETNYKDFVQISDTLWLKIKK